MNRSQLSAGTGLGLSICRRIVQDYGGQISAQPNADRGTTFLVRLPFQQTQLEAAKTPTPETCLHGPRSQVLVIDDEPEIVDMIRRELRPQHEVIGVTSSRAALSLLKRDPGIDVIVCDLFMPGMSGMQLYAALGRTKPELLKRLVFMTGGAFTPAARQFLAGIDNLIVTKPFGTETLLKAIRTTLARVAASSRRALGAAC